jgi:hypothetical protein
MVQRPIMFYLTALRPKMEKEKTWNKNHVKLLGWSLESREKTA